MAMQYNRVQFYLRMYSPLFSSTLPMATPTGALMVPPGAFGAGDGPIQFSHLLCSGTESSLVQCSEQPLFSILCTHQRDAGVICKGVPMSEREREG